MSNNKEESDAQLILRYQSGEKNAFAMLVGRWHKEFCHRANWIVRDADKAKDIAQESWKVIFNKLNDLKDPESFAGWAMRIVYRKSIDSTRRDSKEQSHYNEYKIKLSESSTSETTTTDRKPQLLKEIKSLPDKQQLVLKLFYLEEYSLNEISKMLSLSVGTVKSRLFHARETLKNKLK